MLRLEIGRAPKGLRLFALALLSSELTSSSSSSIPSSIGMAETAAAFFFADLVTGPKYPSCARRSDGVGEGEMTLGVPGIVFEDDLDMVKGGNEGKRIAPET